MDILHHIDLRLLAGALLVLAGIASSLLARRFGAPLLLVFLVLGLLLGVDGPGGIRWDDTRFTYQIGALALALILFDGGLQTKADAVRGVVMPSLVLATIGVMATAALTGAAAWYLLKIEPGDTVLLGRKPTGTLVLDALTPGKRLYLFSTGTGIAPFASLIRDPDTYERYEEVILTHTCRQTAELAYGEHLVATTREDPLVGEMTAGKLRHYTSVTQEAGPRMGRITSLMESGQLFADLGVPPLDPASDRAMICGSMAMIADTKALLEKAGFAEGAVSEPGQFVIERAFVG